MTNLYKLTVSLTKHNAHKVALLLRKYPANRVFKNLSEVSAEPAQARKNLSVMTGDVLPPVWAKAKSLGPEAIDSLVLIAIILSHHELIAAMSLSSNRRAYSGKIQRDHQVSGKAYTNFARVIDQLGYATKLEPDGVTYNLKPMFRLPGLSSLVRDLMQLKLLAAGWDGIGEVSEEATRLKLEKVFGISRSELKAWLRTDTQPASATSSVTPKDEAFFSEESEGTNLETFTFKPGHVPRDIEPLVRSASSKAKANRMHNDIQNRLFDHLVAQLGKNHVGTENSTGSGTSIDVVTSVGKSLTFYEIKTAPSVRTSIRQALPQLLEYAFWPDSRRADELVIVSHLKQTSAAKRYINFLRNEFNLPLSYKHFDMQSNTLS